jgi:hypothetical protein
MSSQNSEVLVNVVGVDSIVKSVIQKFIDRSTFGKQKYGTDLDRTDLTTQYWIQHAQEELMDGILYLEKLKTQIKPVDSIITNTNSE